MNYHDLRSVISSSKLKLEMENPSPSFQVSGSSTRRYVDPTFTKVHGFFETERPTFLLISAVGASGKSMLAAKLSVDTGLPLLDLGAHPPVAAHALTGLLTTTYASSDLSTVFSALKAGTFGVVIDGLDEGLSKAGEKPFEAFLDDLLTLSKGSPKTSFVLLGRTKTIEDCWLYLAGRGANAGLASLDPFTIDKAREYIDAFANPPAADQRHNYNGSRDLILTKLSEAFTQKGDPFLSFIGYPPVLDAVATLLKREKNYHRLSNELGKGAGGQVEKNLLRRIAEYIMNRERDDKVIPQLVERVASALPEQDRAEVISSAYSIEEQCARLIANCMKEPLEMQVFSQPALNSEYEKGLSTYISDHPFAPGDCFRNAVFEAMSIAVLVASAKPSYVELVNRYTAGRKRNYHVVYLLDEMAAGQPLPSEAIHILIGSALELRPARMGAEIVIEPTGETSPRDDGAVVTIGISVEVFEVDSGKESRAFLFASEVTETSTVHLGSRLHSCFVELPCRVLLSGTETELTAPVVVVANHIDIQAQTLIAKAHPADGENRNASPDVADGDRAVVLEAGSATSSLSRVTVEGAELIVSLGEKSGHTYPLVNYIKKRSAPTYTGEAFEIYLKLRKLLTHFRSHGKGQLAKYRDKVDNSRVAGNPIGGRVLDRLLRDGVLYESGNFYFIRPANVDKCLGIPWTALRAGLVSSKLEAYMATI